MATVKTDDQHYINIANAIRSKLGTQQTFRPSEMDDAILQISGTNEKITFVQENPIVAAYLEEVTYDPTDYTESEVPAYFNILTDYRKDQPFGALVTIKSAGTLKASDGKGAIEKTVDGGAETIYNLKPNSANQFAVIDANNTAIQAGTIVPTGNIRMIKADSVNNVRDLGGWACDGGRLKYGLLFRGGEPNGEHNVNISAEDITMFRDLLHIQYELDLRTTSEIDMDTEDTSDDIVSSAFGNDVRYYKRSLNMYKPAVDLSNTHEYGRTVEALQILMENMKYGVPTYFHCVSGADRTATLAFLIEAVCGVSRSDMDKDYELTYFTNEGENARRYRIDSHWVNFVNYIGSMDGLTYRDKAVSWFILAGFTIDEINAFRANMIDGNPETVVSQVDYSCKSLSLDKNTGSIGQGVSETLTATIAPIWATGTVIWTTSNSSIATVTGNGTTATVTGVSAGSATITASCNGHSATYAVTVTAAQLVYTETSRGLTYGVKIDSGDHKTETTGQTNYAATDYISTVGYTQYKMENSAIISSSSDNIGNEYLNFYDADKNYISSSPTGNSKAGAAQDTIEGNLPSGCAFYRVRAYCGSGNRNTYFDASVVSLGKYQ